jgi:hypothetical protein
MDEFHIKTIPLILLEYIVLPLIAIMAAFSLKKRTKKNNMPMEEFLEDLNIDIKVICALGMILFAISNIIHELDHDKSGLTLNYSWVGVMAALLCYIYIHQFYQFRYEGFSNHKAIFFGMRNAVYKDSSWFVIVLVLYVLTGLIIEAILSQRAGDDYSPCYSGRALFYYIFSIVCSYLCLRLFFYLLNQQAKLFHLNNKAYVKTFSSAFVNEPNDINNSEAIKRYKLVLATVKHTDPIRISVYERLSDIYEKAGDSGTAVKYVEEIIKLLSDKQVNRDEEYLLDAYLTKLDLLKRNHMTLEAGSLLTELRQKFPNNEKLKEDPLNPAND